MYIQNTNNQIEVISNNELHCMSSSPFHFVLKHLQADTQTTHTYPCPMMNPSSLPSNSLAKGCSQAMSWWTVSCPKTCGPSRSLFDQYTAPGMQPAMLWELFRSRNLEDEKRPPTRATLMPPYLTHQLCGNEGQKLYNSSPMPTVHRGKWMDACRGRVSPNSVSLQSSTSCRHGTDQMWLQDILQGSLLMQEEQPPLHCFLVMPQF